MALAPILQEELRREIEAEVETLRRRAREQGEALLAEAEDRAKQLRTEADRRLEEEVSQRTRQTLARAELEERNALLRLKHRELDRVFEQSAERLAELREEGAGTYAELMSRVFENCRELLPEGSLQVLLGPGLEGLGERLKDQEELAVESDAQLFGLVVEAAQGRLQCDGTIPRLLTQLRREREADLEAILFGEEA